MNQFYSLRSSKENKPHFASDFLSSLNVSFVFITVNCAAEAEVSTGKIQYNREVRLDAESLEDHYLACTCVYIDFHHQKAFASDDR